MVRLRGHHLICLHFFRGQGYDEDFIRTLKDLLLSAVDEGVLVVDEPDALCSSCRHLSGGACAYTESAEEEVREMDTVALSLLGLQPADSISWDRLAGRMPEFFDHWRKSFCMRCDWKKACEEDMRFRELLLVSK